MTWTFVGTNSDEKSFIINRVNVWSKKWTEVPGEVAKVKDPLYNQDYEFRVYTVDGVRFAAGEFSNSIWGFYVEK